MDRDQAAPTASAGAAASNYGRQDSSTASVGFEHCPPDYSKVSMLLERTRPPGKLVDELAKLGPRRLARCWTALEHLLRPKRTVLGEMDCLRVIGSPMDSNKHIPDSLAADSQTIHIPVNLEHVEVSVKFLLFIPEESDSHDVGREGEVLSHRMGEHEHAAASVPSSSSSGSGSGSGSGYPPSVPAFPRQLSS